MCIYVHVRVATHPFTRISWIEIGGTKYAKEDVVVLESNLLPLFGIIIDILYVSEHYYVAPCSTEFLSHNFHAYEVSKCSSSNTVFGRHSDLVDHNVLSLYSLSSTNNYFVPVKYNLIENIM